MKIVKEMAGGEFVDFDKEVYQSERQTAHRNRAIGYYMEEHKCFPESNKHPFENSLEFKLCSMDVTTESLSYALWMSQQNLYL